MKYFLYLGIVLYMIITPSVAEQLGIKNVGSASSFILILVFLYRLMVYEKSQVSNYKAELYVLITGLIIFGIKYFMGDFEAMRQLVFFLFIPPVVSMLIASQKSPIKIDITNIILLFFVANCILGIYENAFRINLFPYNDELLNQDSLEKFEFRSSGFLGHPLSNAMCLSTIMGFILISSFKKQVKIPLLLLGFIAILCFNARGTIIVWTVLGITFLLKTILNYNTKYTTKFLIILFSFFSVLVISSLISNYGFGGRIIHIELMDDSAKTRLEVFNAFSYISNIDFIYGNPSNYLKIMNKLGAGGVENSLIVMIINYGIVMSILLFIVLYFWVKNLIEHYSILHKTIILLSFILVGSMSNGLSEPMSWIFFLLCANSFPAIDVLTVKRKNYQLRACLKTKSENTIPSLVTN